MKNKCRATKESRTVFSYVEMLAIAIVANEIQREEDTINRT